MMSLSHIFEYWLWTFEPLNRFLKQCTCMSTKGDKTGKQKKTPIILCIIGNFYMGLEFLNKDFQQYYGKSLWVLVEGDGKTICHKL